MLKLLFVVFALLSGQALAAYGEGGASMAIDGQTGLGNSCTTGSNGHCAPMTLSWDKGTTNYYPYALYRLQSFNCGGSDVGTWPPGIQIACPVLGTSSTTIVPSVPNIPGCQGVIRYAITVNWGIGGCGQIDGNYNPISETAISVTHP